MLTRAARDRPAKEALVSRGQRITFAELEEASQKIANFLHRRGVAPGMRVGIYTPKCVDEVAVIFAVARAGCVLVHINPSFRDEKLQHIVGECELAAMFFHPQKSGAIERARQQNILPGLLVCMAANASPPLGFPALMLGAILAEPAYRLPPGLHRQSAGADLAAIIYTSGTTASAKGIMVTHAILSEATLVSAQVLENVPADRLISITPFSFDGALSQLFTATLVGGTLVLQESHFPRDVVRTLIDERITGFHAVPSFWRMLLEQLPSFADYRFPHLRYLSLIGEVFPEPELARLKRILHSTQFYMMYGTTEAFRSTCLSPDDFASKRRSVGKALPGVELRVVDEAGNACAAGQIGEIVHSGAFVSPGYWKRRGDATFREDGVHTGDLGFLDEQGYLYFVGRKDTMLKRLGYQVYPEEIEACVQAIDDVALTAVVCLLDTGRGPRIRACLVCRPDSSLTREAVAQYCRQQLPYYMMPDEIVFLRSMPLTATGKIDRAQLVRQDFRL